MNQVMKSIVNGKNEWCCGKKMLGGFLCGEPYGRYKFAVCDGCLLKLIRRDAKIKAIKSNEFLSMEEKHEQVKHVELGWWKS